MRLHRQSSALRLILFSHVFHVDAVDASAPHVATFPILIHIPLVFAHLSLAIADADAAQALANADAEAAQAFAEGRRKEDAEDDGVLKEKVREKPSCGEGEQCVGELPKSYGEIEGNIDYPDVLEFYDCQDLDFGAIDVRRFGMWQLRYSRDSDAASERIRETVQMLQSFSAQEYELAWRLCPGFVLETLFDAILVIEKDEGYDEARKAYIEAMRIREIMQYHPQIQALEKRRWPMDTLASYPLLFETESAAHDCYGSKLKIFVYDVPKRLIARPLKCNIGQWGTEVSFHKWFKAGACRTMDPDEADFFYVPVYGTCAFLEYHIQEDIEATELIFKPLFEYLRDIPQFHARATMDHMFLFADGQGPRIWDSIDLVRSDALFFSVESKCPTWGMPVRNFTDLYPCMSRWKDFIIPGHTDVGRVHALRKLNKPSSERGLLATFHGRDGDANWLYQMCGVRSKVMDMAGMPGMDVGGFVNDYFTRKGDSHFCLVPGGLSPWTNHLYESFFAGCIPVIISDEYQVAFDDLPWENFSIKFPEKHVGPSLYKYLEWLVLNDPDSVRAMKFNLERHACWFDYYSEDPDCSPYLRTMRFLEKKLELRPAFHRWWNSPMEFIEGGMAHLNRPSVYHTWEKEIGNNTNSFSWLGRDFVHTWQERKARKEKKH